MSKLLVGNWSHEAELANLAEHERTHIGSQGQRMLWSARPGDVVLLPTAPDARFLSYVTGLLGFPAEAVHVVIPPPGHLGAVLTRDRLAGTGFLAELAEVVRDRGVDRVEAFYFDAYVNRLVRQLGLDKGTPGFGFLEQGGHELLNSKVAFRAVAAGIGLPVPDGVVTDRPEDAVAFLADLFAAGRPAIVKKDVHVAGMGNEVLTPVDGVEAVGTRHRTVLTGHQALVTHVRQRWPWYTDGDRRRVVLEEYVPESASLWGEAEITEDGAEVYGYGEVRMKPVIDGVDIPAARRGPADPFLTALGKLAGVMGAMGYRGLVNIDAMLTPDGRLLFNEFNARFGGSTHLFRIGQRVVGGRYLEDRCLVERRTCAVPAFDEALAELARRGLAYDPATRTGVVIPVYGTDPGGTGGEACLVAEDAEAARALEHELTAAFPG
ncbi:peptide ligase PGM1-related protein [Amycolatopsis vancoresmycina]|uniref:ATP-grasp domain-containing protein n=1 Tax=Amycolatopsis vancoresmycina DSM 44592 TaxID=1292037 RepID=R1HX52_9PSEU|nr:peptide ligase PGM1-related protein [Amycolatopsis vancoresmycina]EOD64906.1 hypothetical protein H480_29406 [Amycolatopsis vancoresmycina DSM 44592]